MRCDAWPRKLKSPRRKRFERRQDAGEQDMKTPTKKRNKTARLKAQLKAKLRRARLRVSKGQRKYSR